MLTVTPQLFLPPIPPRPLRQPRKLPRAAKRRERLLCAWDAARYQDQHSFVWRFGANLLELLDPQPGERILDIGCGTGQLTAEIARRGARVTGLDNSAEMLADARKNFPELTICFGGRLPLRFPERFDAVFSNAALHWVKRRRRSRSRPSPEPCAPVDASSRSSAATATSRPFKPLCELSSALAPMTSLLGITPASANTRLYSNATASRCATRACSTGQRRSRAKMAGPLAADVRSGLPAPPLARTRRRVVRQLVEQLRPALHRNGIWTVDYRRIRVVAIRTT